MDYLDHICGGRWEPISGWTGRYRCKKCGAFGYRYASAPKAYRHIDKPAPENIVPYRCGVKDYNNVAIMKTERGRSGKWRCKEHGGVE